MSAYRARSAAMARQRSLSLMGVTALALCTLAAGCAAPPPSPVAGGGPSDPAARGRPVDYRSTVEPYKRERPVDPAPWGEQNQRVAPAPKN